ncbi:pentatricopeptide repeat-containing protein At3g49730-like [Magnolia sinica]|uniref:pentatricopeptide repeat-containing protein At3g49730-like n=1 Tax=Magnolia sinica TaxID=86752 RepID=UPI002659D39B|nr:pentatricopeptide repeat-containing protein At3g49730-like [Magnolia sinica]
MRRPSSTICLFKNSTVFLPSSKPKPSLKPIPIQENLTIYSPIIPKATSHSSISQKANNYRHPNPKDPMSVSTTKLTQEQNPISPKTISNLSSPQMVSPQITPKSNSDHPNRENPALVSPNKHSQQHNRIPPKPTSHFTSLQMGSSQITQKSYSHHQNPKNPIPISPNKHTQEQNPNAPKPTPHFTFLQIGPSQITSISNSDHQIPKNSIPSSPNKHTQEEEEENSTATRFPVHTSQFLYQNDNSPNLHKSHHQNHEDPEYAADVEKIYRILRKFHSRAPKLELALQESKIPVSPTLVSRVLNRCGDAGNLGYRFFSWASKQPGYRNSYDVYKSMIKILGKMRQFGAVWALINEMQNENPELITADIFIILMRRFASSRMVEKAIGVLDEMPRFGCEPDEHVFGCLLDALCKNGKVKEAALLFEDMRIRFPPNLKHFTSLLYGWCKEGKLIEAKFVLVQMREAGFDPDVVVYNNLLGGYAAAGKMRDAFDLLDEMKRKGCGPNATSYTILIQALCANEKTEEAMRVFIDMCRNGCRADVVTYTTLISGFCKWGKIDRAYDLLDSMIRNGCNPNQTTYFCILAAHENKEELEECLELVSEMSKAGCVPDLNIYNIVIRLACKLGELKEAVSAWNDVETNGLSPGVDTFTIMIHGFLGQGSLIDACKYFKEMVERGLLSTPQYGTLKELLNSLLRAEKLELAKDVWASIVNKGCQLNVCAWTIWIHALFTSGHVKEACSYCLDMLENGLMPQPDTFAKLMRGLKKLYNRQIAAEITEKVRQMAADRGVTFKSYKRRGVRDEKEKLKAKKDGRKRRGRKRQWGRASRADIS